MAVVTIGRTPLAERIILERAARDWSQAELAERAGMSVRAIRDLEHGVSRTPRRDTLLLLSDALELGEQERADLREAARRPTHTSDTRQTVVPQSPQPLHLPLQPTPFIGRESEVEGVRAKLLSHGMRLLTLTGPGGTGKTRLAIRVAEEVADRF